MAEAVCDVMAPLTLSRLRHAPLVSCLAQTADPIASSAHFAVYGLSDDVVVVHDFAASQIDNNISAHVANELLPLLARSRPSPAADGRLENEQEVFERCVGAIVRSMDSSERGAWRLFYDNTLDALHAASAPAACGSEDFIADFRAIYRRVAELVAGVPGATMLDAATCFGFLPLFLAAGGSDAAPRRIVGCDINPALVSMAEAYRRQRFVPRVSFVCADLLDRELTRVLAADGRPFDVVTAIHLLEHLAPEQTVRALDQLWALTGRRLIVAVPFETVPDPRFGHRQVFDQASLAALGRRIRGRARCFTDHGGWLVIDREPGDAAVPEPRQ